jgi:hypothetical protein
MSPKVGVIVEGLSDFEILRKMEGLGLGRADLRPVEKEPPLYKVAAYAKAFKRRNKNKVIFLKDLNCKEYKEVMQRYREIEGVDETCIVVHEIEAWLLADEEALAKALRVKRVENFPNPEELHDPKRKLEELFKRHKGKEYKYGEIKDGTRIAQHLSINKVSQKCRSFEKFFRTLKE